MGRHSLPRWWARQTQDRHDPHTLGILAIRRAVTAQTWDELTAQAAQEDQRRGNQPCQPQ